MVAEVNFLGRGWSVRRALMPGRSGSITIDGSVTLMLISTGRGNAN
jgi:hypothetical protein